jgi:hypothetical protein
LNVVVRKSDREARKVDILALVIKKKVRKNVEAKGQISDSILVGIQHLLLVYV